MHRRLTEEERHSREQSVSQLIKERGALLENTIQWTEARWELEPLDALAWLWAQRKHPGAAWLLNQVGERWHALAEWIRAEPLMRRALEIDEKSYGKDHPRVARDLNNLAQLLQATNRLSEAEPLMRRALEIDEKSFGRDHPNVAIRLNNLAQLLQATNRLAEAEPLMRRALKSTSRASAGTIPTSPSGLNNLAAFAPGHQPAGRGRTSDAPRPCNRREELRQGPPRRRHRPQQPGSVASGHQPAGRGRTPHATGSCN